MTPSDFQDQTETPNLAPNPDGRGGGAPRLALRSAEESPY